MVIPRSRSSQIRAKKIVGRGQIEIRIAKQLKFTLYTITILSVYWCESIAFVKTLLLCHKNKPIFRVLKRSEDCSFQNVFRI